MTDSADAWNARYRQAATSSGSVWSLEPNRWLSSTIEGLDLPAGDAIDLGAGEGRNALWLASLGWNVTAVDFAAAGLEVGAARAQQLGVHVEWVLADASTWLSPHPVDLAVIAYLHLPVDRMHAAIAHSAASLSRGGQLLLIGHDRDNLTRGVGGPQDPEILLSVEQLEAAASTLYIVECRQLERETPAGTAIDVVLIARK